MMLSGSPVTSERLIESTQFFDQHFDFGSSFGRVFFERNHILQCPDYERAVRGFSELAFSVPDKFPGCD